MHPRALILLLSGALHILGHVLQGIHQRRHLREGIGDAVACVDALVPHARDVAGTLVVRLGLRVRDEHVFAAVIGHLGHVARARRALSAVYALGLDEGALRIFLVLFAVVEFAAHVVGTDLVPLRIDPTVHLPLIEVVVRRQFHFLTEGVDVRIGRRHHVFGTHDHAVHRRTAAVYIEIRHFRAVRLAFGHPVRYGIERLDAFRRRPFLFVDRLCRLVVDAHSREGFTLAADRVAQEEANQTVFTCRLNVGGDVDRLQIVLRVPA